MKTVKEKINEAIVKHNVKLNNSINGTIFIDLDLPSGLLWADRNIGANYPEDYGNYYFIGDENPIDKNTKFTDYKFYDGDVDEYGNMLYSKYNMKDRKEKLDKEDDIARIFFNKAYMPTERDIKELLDNTTQKLESFENGNKYFKITSKKNNNSIILPLAGLYNPKKGFTKQNEVCKILSKTLNIDDINNCVVCLRSFSGSPEKIQIYKSPRHASGNIRAIKYK